MSTKYLNVREASELLGVCVQTMQRWDREGVLKSGRTITNRRYYTLEQLQGFRNIKPDGKTDRRTVAYCRVSSQAQRPDLKNQRIAVSEFCTVKGLSNVEFIEEIGGGLNFKRKLFLQLVDAIVAREVGTLIVAHKDRLARFGLDLLKHICTESGCELLILCDDKVSPEQEMVQDLMTIIHCFSSRLYGLRNYRKSLRAALKDK